MARRRTSTRTPKKNIKWTAEEEEIILDEIGKSPTNLKVAFIAAAERLPIRSYYACQSYWYTKMANRSDIVGRIMVGKHATVKNKIRLTNENMESFKTTHNESLWKRILNLLFGI